MRCIECNSPRRSIVVLAWATPLCVLPSSVRRLFAVRDLPPSCPQRGGTDA